MRLSYFVLCSLFLFVWLGNPSQALAICDDDSEVGQTYGCTVIGGVVWDLDNNGVPSAPAPGVRVKFEALTGGSTMGVGGDDRGINWVVTTTDANGVYRFYTNPNETHPGISMRNDSGNRYRVSVVYLGGSYANKTAGAIGYAKTDNGVYRTPVDYMNWTKNSSTGLDTPFRAATYDNQHFDQLGDRNSNDDCSSPNKSFSSTPLEWGRCNFGLFTRARCTSYTYPTSPLEARKSYPVYVTMQNTGTTAWTEATSYRLGAQNPENTMQWGGFNRVRLANTIPVVSSVPPGGSAQFVFNVIPQSAGDFNFQWQMIQDGVGWLDTACPSVPMHVDPARTVALPEPPSVIPSCPIPGTSGTISWTNNDPSITSYRVQVPALSIDTTTNASTRSYGPFTTTPGTYPYTVTATNTPGSTTASTGNLICTSSCGSTPTFNYFNVQSPITCGGGSRINWSVSCADTVRVAYQPFNGYHPTTASGPAADGFTTLAISHTDTYNLYVPGPGNIQVKLTATKGGVTYSPSAPLVSPLTISCTVPPTGGDPPDPGDPSGGIFHKLVPANTATPISGQNLQLSWESYSPPTGQPAGGYQLVVCAGAANCGSPAVNQWLTTTSTRITMADNTTYYWQVYWKPTSGFTAMMYLGRDGHWHKLARATR